MLNAGEIPNLFNNDEKVTICERMRSIDRSGPVLDWLSFAPRECVGVFIFIYLELIGNLQINRARDKSKQTDGTPLALFNLFVEYCREQLHIVLVMSPIGDNFRNRLRKFPALVNCCTIDWLQVQRATKLLLLCHCYFASYQESCHIVK